VTTKKRRRAQATHVGVIIDSRPKAEQRLQIAQIVSWAWKAFRLKAKPAKREAEARLP
jgi:hypothetical protein